MTANYPAEDHDRDHLGMYGGSKIWQHIWAAINEKYGANPPLTDSEFVELRQCVGELLSILGEIIGLTDDNGPATLSVLLKHVDNERVRRIPAFDQFLGVLVSLQDVFDTVRTEMHAAFSELENGLDELAEGLETGDEDDPDDGAHQDDGGNAADEAKPAITTAPPGDAASDGRTRAEQLRQKFSLT